MLFQIRICGCPYTDMVDFMFIDPRPEDLESKRLTRANPANRVLRTMPKHGPAEAEPLRGG